jgi:hypothetical protein
MRKNDDLHRDVQNSNSPERVLNTSETGVKTKAGKHLKKLLLLTSLAGIGFFLNGCMAGYVATEPTYMEYARPPRPSEAHIWINGDWGYNRQNHVYVQKVGYWEKPNTRHTYVPGHWQSNQKGHYWVSGKKQKQNRKADRRNR